jgi:hypothetical protein
VTPRQRRVVQAVESRHSREDSLRVQARELPRFGERRIGQYRTSMAPQACHESLGAQDPAAKGLAKRWWRRIVQAALHKADVVTTAYTTWERARSF